MHEMVMVIDAVRIPYPAPWSRIPD